MSTHRYSVIVPDKKTSQLKSFFISHARYESDWISLLHTHPFTEVFYVIDGAGSFITNQHEFNVQKNDLVIVNSNIEHTEVSSKDHPLEYIAIGISNISFTNADTSTAEEPFLFYNFHDKKEEVLFYLETIIHEVKNQQHDFEMICQHLLNVLILKLQRQFKLKLEVDHQLSIGKEVTLAKEYIDHNFKENITLDSLAEIVHLNKFYFSRTFKNETSHTPIEYINIRRIEEAKVLLKTTDYNISEISNIIGFTSQSYFSEVFNKHMSQTPSKYRKLNLIPKHS